MSKVPLENPIDKKMNDLVKNGLIAKSVDHSKMMFDDKEMVVMNALNPNYWQDFFEHLTIEDCEYILSFKQQGNWNKRLYSLAKEKVDSLIDKELLD